MVLGPHGTNLGRGRALSPAHVEHYRRRAAGGAGLIVTEVASVHDSDHPSRRAPLAADCGPGWARVATACRPHGTLVLAGLGHAGAQGISAHHRRALWAPSPVPDVTSGEVPRAMSAADVAELVAAFAAAAASARDAGLDGVEVQAGQGALLRQFLSPLTNHRDDAYGHDRGLLLREVLGAVRAALGSDRLLGLRLAVDELAPWGGLTPADVAVPAGVDLVAGVRGSATSVPATHPDAHTPPGAGLPLARALRARPGGHAVVLTGGVVDVDEAAAALRAGDADLVEMTRAQLADPSLVATLRAGRAPRPCVRTNQRCRTGDGDPPVTCTVAPHIGVDLPAGPPAGGLVVVGGGPAGLEAARTAARAGIPVTLHERAGALGGALRGVARLPGHHRFADLVAWWAGELERLGATVHLGSEVTAPTGRTVWATGALAPPPRDLGAAPMVSAGDHLAGATVTGPVAVLDPLGASAGTGVAELLAGAGIDTVLVTPDPVAGVRLDDPVAARRRLARAGVGLVPGSEPVAWAGGSLTVRDVATGARRSLRAATLVDAGAGRPGTVPPGATGAGDVVAPRTVHEAVLEGRRAVAAAVGPAR